MPSGPDLVAVSDSGDHAFVTEAEVEALRCNPGSLAIERQAALKARFFLGGASTNLGSARLVKSRRAAKRETVRNGPALHIIVPTLQCAHWCQYCQVSRSLDGAGHTMSITDLNAACDSVFESASQTLTIEFQGGDPLIRFDLVQQAIVRIKAKNEIERRNLRFVVASTLHQLTNEMCDFFKMHSVLLSTSMTDIAVHNKNRPLPTRDAHERTLAASRLLAVLWDLSPYQA